MDEREVFDANHNLIGYERDGIIYPVYGLFGVLLGLLMAIIAGGLWLIVMAAAISFVLFMTAPLWAPPALLYLYLGAKPNLDTKRAQAVSIIALAASLCLYIPASFVFIDGASKMAPICPKIAISMEGLSLVVDNNSEYTIEEVQIWSTPGRIANRYYNLAIRPGTRYTRPASAQEEMGLAHFIVTKGDEKIEGPCVYTPSAWQKAH